MTPGDLALEILVLLTSVKHLSGIVRICQDFGAIAE
jgi:hypothetical protein